MSDAPLSHGRLSARRKLIALIATYIVVLVALGCAIWFESPTMVAQGLLAAALVIALLAAICAGRAVAHSHASMSVRERPSTSGREAGVLTFIVLASLAAACSYFITPRSWPTTVEKALVMLDEQVDAESKRELVYTGYDDLADLQATLGASIRDRFGLTRGNKRLLRDCDREYMQADVCSSVILSRYWRKLREGLPAAERLPLEALEAKMERVRLKSHEFRQAPLQDVVAFFNEAILAQLPEDARFTIRYDAAHADTPVSVAWHAMGDASLREVLANMTASTNQRVRKTPPDLRVEPDLGID
jgi:hypothetical protein